jgi:hypothetical protein
MGQRLAIAMTVSIVTLGIAACGDDEGGDTTTTTSTTPLTTQQFVRDANKICKSSNGKIERASSQFFANAPPNEEPPPEEIEKFGRRTVFPTIQAGIDRIRALGAPAGDEDEVNAILEAAEAGLEKLEQDPQQLARGGAATAFEQAQKLAGDYGLDECARG